MLNIAAAQQLFNVRFNLKYEVINILVSLHCVSMGNKKASKKTEPPGFASGPSAAARSSPATTSNSTTITSLLVSYMNQLEKLQVHP
ncbi:hypothetical protein FocTR4_00015383 [Fusarium oxysporum f. sp. cubense]|uniref:Uncharacterized protein n=1 Tax=Fusarium oxysporum f. sp. cubense TaxID=61366 RepID=A0A5C6SYJ5_FUSOC|nr:hypothetical protein FocTR4_00015383 [Fusarium oxysporum f. sp. cubense]